MEPSRLLLFESGASLGVFSAERAGREQGSGRSSVIVMEPEGACFTHIHPDGTCHLLLSDFCRRDLLPQLTALANFRNAHSPQPYLSRRLHATEKTSGSRGRRVSRFAFWPEGRSSGPGGPSSKRYTAHADGGIEVHAEGGNARLKLSASRTLCEVEFAAGVPPTRLLPGKQEDYDKEENDGKEESRYWFEASSSDGRRSLGGGTGMAPCRAWVTREFLVGRSPTPPEFAHALRVALSASCSRVEDGLGDCSEGGDEDSGTVVSELPLPLKMPDRARWDTVQTSPIFDSSPDAWPPLADHRRVRLLGDLAYPSPTPYGAGAEDSSVGPRLLTVDAMKLSEGTGFAGPLAAIVEYFGGCTYRVVIDDEGSVGGGADERGEGEVSVHAVIRADGTEVLLEGDFVRLFRPSAAPSTRRQRDRLLHVSATSTVHFRVHERPMALSRPSASGGTVACDAGAHGTNASDGGRGRERGWKLISLGDITSRAVNLRRQYVAHSRRTTRSSEGKTLQLGVGVTNGAYSAMTSTRPAIGLHVARGSTAKKCASALSAEVVEREERGGASFVAFADGRARGAFSDRTIVIFGVPYVGMCEKIAPHTPTCHVAKGKDASRHLGDTVWGGMSPEGPVQGHQEMDQDIECILPDGTVKRFTLLSVLRKDSFSARRGISSGFDGLVPYIAAVRRFEVRAFASPSKRRAAAAREEAVRRAAIVEAEKNRRFVALHRLTKQSHPDRRDAQSATDGRAAETPTYSVYRPEYPSSKNSGSSTNRYGHGFERKGGKKNVDRVGVDEHTVGYRAPEGSRERNALVRRVLADNLKVIMDQTVGSIP